VKVGLTANPQKPVALELARRALAHIGDRAEVILSTEAREVAPDRLHVPIEEIRADVLVAIGGDGTFLYTLRRSELPLLPINAGTVGVLAEVAARRSGELEGALDRLLEGHYFLEERMKLAGEVDGVAVGDATNEFVIHSAEVGKMALFELAFDHHVVGQLQADGLILATPTGSTAYSLSSLGPIVDPALEAIVLTAIAPFRVQARAVVVEPLHPIRLRALEVGRGAVAIADGQEEYPIAAGGAVTIYRSPRRATLVRFGSRLFERLRGKRILPWTERADEEATPADLPPGA
jgi:NAD+ kinase